MASKFLSSSALKATRGYAAQAAAKPKSAESQSLIRPKEALKTTTVKNGLVVASIETNAPVSRVAVAYRAGSRNEAVDAAGVSHTLRIAAGLATKNSTQFGITRTLQQAGASLTCTGGREHLIYSVDFTRDQAEAVLPKLGDVAARPTFKPWEIADNTIRVQLDLALLEPQTKALEALHKAAYHSGLGNSLFCPDYMVGKHTSAMLENYFSSNALANNAAVVGVGVPHEALVAFAQSLPLQSGQVPASGASKVHPSEVRVEVGGSVAYVAIATEGASSADIKQLLTFALLQRALGGSPSTKRGVSGGKLQQAVAAASEHAAVSAINLSYSDSGLLGFVVAAPAAEAGKVVGAALKTLRSVKVSDADLTRAKAQLKVDILSVEETSAGLLEELALQAVTRGSVTSAADLAAAVDKISAADVNAAASKVSSGKIAVGAYGNLSTVPFVDEL